MKKSIGSHISSRLRNLSKAELDAAAKQVLIILERAVVAGFISDDEKLYLELNKLFPTKMSVVVTDDQASATSSLSRTRIFRWDFILPIKLIPKNTLPKNSGLRSKTYWVLFISRELLSQREEKDEFQQFFSGKHYRSSQLYAGS